MTRYMVDAIGSCSGNLPADTPTVAGYITGTPGIIWTAADWARFDGVKVPIDQAPDELLYAAHQILVLDIERGAKTIQNAINQARLRAAQGLSSVFYVSASNFSLAQRSVAAAGLTAHVSYWVANWGLTEAEAEALTRGRVIGIQFASADYPPTASVLIPGTKLTLGKVNADLSVISTTWAPATKPAKPKPVKKKTITIAKPHPKVVGSSAGAAIGVGITAILHAAGVHITPTEAAAITTISTAISGYLTPSKAA